VEEALVRGVKSTIALAAVLLGLVGYIYFVDSKKPASGAAETKARAFTVEADQIEEIQIKPVASESSRAQKANGTWQLVEPEKTDADQGALTNTATSLSSLEVNGVVDDSPADLAQYGLNPAKLDVAFRVKGQKDLQHLLIGEKTAAGGDLYAKRADQKRVFLISSYLDGTFNRSPFDLRDKAVLKFDHDKVDGLEIAREGMTTQLAKSNGEWTIVKPYKARADFGTAEAALTSLSSTQMQKIVSPDAPELLKTYGLDRPAATTTVMAGSARAALAIGKVEGDAAYARDLSRPMVFTIPQATAVDLEKGADMFRRKDMFDGRSFNASGVELHRGAEMLAFEHSKDKDGKDVWKNAAGKVVDTAKVEDVLMKLSNIRANSFQDRVDPALKMPTLVATVKMDNGKTETVTFAKQGDAVIANRSDEPGSATVEMIAFNEAMTAIDAVK
jgi:hypothetical protein